MYDVVKIEISRLGVIYPRISSVKEYTDVKYITTRIIRNDWYSESYVTDEKYKLIDDVLYDNRTIQNILYRKYRMNIIAKEWNGIQLMKYAQRIRITDTAGNVHHAKILSLEDGEAIGDTLNYKYSIVYADVNPANYWDNQQSVVNFLRSDRLFIETPYTTTQLNKFKIVTNNIIDSGFPYNVNTGGGSSLRYNYTVYTCLQPFYKNTEISEKTNELEGLINVSNSTSQEYVVLRFYLNEIEKNFIKKYARICSGSVGDSYIIVNNSSTEYQAIERVNLIIDETPTGIDCYKVDVELKYKNLNYYHY